MNTNNHLSEYQNRITSSELDKLVHKGRPSILGDLYHPVENRTLETYYADLVTHMNTRVKLSPESAVGGDWDTHGDIQFNLLRSLGLKPHHTLLDFGCGTLRAGRYFIDYLEGGNYTGIDISPEAINFGYDLAANSKWGKKDFNLIVNEYPANKNVIPIDNDKTFDFIVSISVCYDMPEPVFRNFLNEAIDHMHSESVFIFSWVKRKETRPASEKLFCWLHSEQIVHDVVEERGVEYSELPFQLHPEDEQIVSCIEV